MTINKISFKNNNTNLLENFINNLGEASNKFRYFNSRDIQVINNHVVTLLVLENNIPIGYGHLDKEQENIWLGICVLPNQQGKGIGNIIMSELIEEAKNQKIENILLTVDNNNLNAQKLYEKFDFKRIKNFKNPSIYKYSLKINER